MRASMLVEEQNLLRETVALTARSLGMGMGIVHEAANLHQADRLILKPFRAKVLLEAFESFGARPAPG
jgi:hypothetical protein